MGHHNQAELRPGLPEDERVRAGADGGATSRRAAQERACLRATQAGRPRPRRHRADGTSLQWLGSAHTPNSCKILRTRETSMNSNKAFDVHVRVNLVCRFLFCDIKRLI